MYTCSLVPRPLPDFILQSRRKISNFFQQLRDKIWEWPGDEASIHVHYMEQNLHSLVIQRPQLLQGSEMQHQTAPTLNS